MKQTLRFGDTISISLAKRSIDQLRQFVVKRPNAHLDVPNLTDYEIVECVVRSFAFEENWRYD